MLDKDENACYDVVTVDLQTLTNSKAPDTGREKSGGFDREAEGSELRKRVTGGQSLSCGFRCYIRR